MSPRPVGGGGVVGPWPPGPWEGGPYLGRRMRWRMRAATRMRRSVTAAGVITTVAVAVLVLVLSARGAEGGHASSGTSRNVTIIDPDVPPLDPSWERGGDFWARSDRGDRILAEYYRYWADGNVTDNMNPGSYCPAVPWRPLGFFYPSSGYFGMAFDRIRDSRLYLDDVRAPLEMYLDADNVFRHALLAGLVAEWVVSADGGSIWLSWFTPPCGTYTGGALRPYEYAVEVTPTIGAAPPRTFAVTADAPCGTRFEHLVDGLEPDVPVDATVSLMRAILPGPVGPETVDGVAASVSIVVAPREAPSSLSAAGVERGRYEATFARPRMSVVRQMEGQLNATGVDASSLGVSWVVPVDVNGDGLLDLFGSSEIDNTYKLFINAMDRKMDASGEPVSQAGEPDIALFAVISDPEVFEPIAREVEPWDTYWAVTLDDDGDGRDEVLILSWNANVLVRFPMNGTGVDEVDPNDPLFEVRIVDELALNGTTTYYADVNDYNGDGACRRRAPGFSVRRRRSIAPSLKAPSRARAPAIRTRRHAGRLLL